MMDIQLPNSKELLVDDRFSLLESDQEQVLFWDLLVILLSKEVQDTRQLVDVFDSLHCILSHDFRADYGFLIEFIRTDELGKKFFSEIWPTVVELALKLPDAFPDGSLPVLNVRDTSTLTLSRMQCACLISHQFLCSIRRPPWYQKDRSLDFQIWYKADQAHGAIVSAYLKSLFAYLLLKPFKDTTSAAISFILLSNPVTEFQDALTSSTPIKCPDHLETSEARFPSARFVPVKGSYNIAEVISANKDIGFGLSGTQEEILVGTSPEACPSVLFTTTLNTSEVLVIEGAIAMSSVIGYNRSARLERIQRFPDATQRDWHHRTLLFMDALELDAYDGSASVPDLMPGHISREYIKACVAFGAYRQLGRAVPFECVVTPLWGCGAFCGDSQIKLLIMLCAAASTSVAQLLVVTSEDRKTMSQNLETLNQSIKRDGLTVGTVLVALMSLSSSDTRDGRRAFDFVTWSQITGYNRF